MSLIGNVESPPVFRAISSSTRQLFQLLNCIRFALKAHVQITNEGLRFAVEESKVMQGLDIPYSYVELLVTLRRNRIS